MNGPRIRQEMFKEIEFNVELRDKGNFTLSAQEFLAVHNGCKVEAHSLGGGIEGPGYTLIKRERENEIREFTLYCLDHKVYSKSFMQELPPA